MPGREALTGRLGALTGLHVLLAIGLGACSPPRAIEAAHVLADLGAGPGEVTETGPQPTRLIIPGAQPGAVFGDLYWPADRAGAALILVPGAVPEGKDDPRLVAFAESLARARFAVLVPEIPNLRALHVSPYDADSIARAIEHLAACFPPAEEPAVGLVAISYAAGPALLAALRPDTGQLVRFVVAIGGYYDLEAVVTYFTTGYYRSGPGEPWRYRTPNAYGKWVFVRANAVRLDDPADRALLAEMAARKLDDPDADIADLRPRLGPEGRAVMVLLDNRDPDRAAGLIAALPQAVLADLRALDLKRQDLSRLRAHLILVHGHDDPIIPSTESLALAAAAPDDQASLYLVDSLGHVELGPAGLIDDLRLWRAVYQLLSDRDAAPAPDRARCLAHIALSG
jgi:pimeloyl-ACP methyl ester carboxylesterase